METEKKRSFGNIWNAIYIPLLGLAMIFALSAIGYKTLQGQSIATVELNPFLVGGIALVVLGSVLAAVIAIVSNRKQQASE